MAIGAFEGIFIKHIKKEIDEISQQCEKINHAFATMFAYCKDNEVNEETTQAVTDLYEKYQTLTVHKQS